MTTHKNKIIAVTRVDFSWTVWQLKQEIERKEGVPPDQQRLIFMGKFLANDNTLKECNISPDSSLHMVAPRSGD